MRYEPSQFDGCLINPFNDMKTPLTEQFPFLGKEFQVTVGLPKIFGRHKDVFIRYIVCVYDPHSPFVLDFRDVAERKVKVGEELSLPLTKDKTTFMTPVIGMFQCNNEHITKMIIRYCRLLHSPTYSQLVAYQETFGEILRKLTYNPPKSRDDEPLKTASAKAALTKQAEDLADRISALENELLTQDRNAGLIDELYSISDYDDSKIELQPETYEGPEEPVRVKIHASK